MDRPELHTKAGPYAPIREALEQFGFAVAPLLEDEALRQLRSDSRAWLSGVEQQQDLGGNFLSAGRLTAPELRSASTAIVAEHVLPALRRHPFSASFRHVSGVHLIKPPGKKGTLNPHQDSAHTDERKTAAYYVWVPLDDVDAGNGSLAVVPGSHRWGIPQRSLSIPWPLRHIPHQLLLRQNLEVLEVPAGHAVFFNAALIHASGLNLSGQVRLAVNALMLPEGEAYRHYYRDRDSPSRKVEVFEVSPEFFYHEDILARPSKRWPKLGEESWVDRRVSLWRLYRNLRQTPAWHG